ncbi:MAG: hypothetical protein IPN29_19135 [Saprospiraceae bacterium]|nr:hypothetical protein [Saprospiraceae bacterium]
MKVLLFLILSLFVFSCKNASAPNEQTSEAPQTEEAAKVDETGPEFTSAYICPMHCKGSGSEKPGICPACGMDYVMNDKKGDDGHDHEGHDHEGHEH